MPISVSLQKTSLQNFHWATGTRKSTFHLDFEANCRVLENPRYMGHSFTNPSHRKPEQPFEAETGEKISKEVHLEFSDGPTL